MGTPPFTESHHFATPSNSVLKNYELNWWQRAAIVRPNDGCWLNADNTNQVSAAVVQELNGPYQNTWNLFSQSTTHRNPPGTRFFSTKQKTCGLYEQPPPTLSQSTCLYSLLILPSKSFCFLRTIWERLHQSWFWMHWWGGQLYQMLQSGLKRITSTKNNTTAHYLHLHLLKCHSYL